MTRSSFDAMKHQGLAGVLLIAACSNPTVVTAAAPPSTSVPSPAQTASAAGFYCNMKALSPAERKRHTQLTEYLIHVRKQIVELPKGYEFQYSPADVSLSQLVEWVTAEEKCCPFFNFHIDLEREGELVCLGLSGADGIKQFIRSEFQIPKI